MLTNGRHSRRSNPPQVDLVDNYLVEANSCFVERERERVKKKDLYVEQYLVLLLSTVASCIFNFRKIRGLNVKLIFATLIAILDNNNNNNNKKPIYLTY